MPYRFLLPVCKYVKRSLLLFRLPRLLAIIIEKLAQVEYLCTGFECSSLGYYLTLSCLNLLHLIQPPLLFLLSLQGFQDLQSAQFLVLFNRLDKDESPLLEFFLRLKRHLHRVNLIWSCDLYKIFAIITAAPADSTQTQIYEPPGRLIVYQDIYINIGQVNFLNLTECLSLTYSALSCRQSSYP